MLAFMLRSRYGQTLCPMCVKHSGNATCSITKHIAKPQCGSRSAYLVDANNQPLTNY
jgi:hypothetical protein